MKLTKTDRVWNLSNLIRWKFISILIQKKEQKLLISLKKTFLSWWLLVSMVKQRNIWKKKIRVRLVNNEKDFLKYTSRPTHITHKIFDKNYAAINEIKPVVTLNKPIYVAFNVLELSNWLMYNIHYNFIKKILMLNWYLLTQTVLLMKLDQKIFMKNTNICLTLAIFTFYDN